MPRSWRSASEIEGLLSARELSITHKTVEKHLGSAYQKLNISSRAQLDAYGRLGAAKDSRPAYDFVQVSLTVTTRPLVSVNDVVIVFFVSLSFTNTSGA